MVPSDLFTSRMSVHWKQTLGNHLTPELVTVWKAMADTFNGAAAKPSSQWHLLNPETGTGKSEGSFVYLGLLGQYAKRRMEDGATVTGAIFVARTIVQCEDAVTKINRHAGMEVAITRHSQNSITLQQTISYPIIVVTHEAFVRSVEKDTSGNFVGVWSSLSTWLGGERRLTIVDESLTNVVEHHIVSSKSIHLILSDVPSWMVSKFIREIETLRRIDQIIFDRRKQRLEGREVLLGWTEKGFDFPDDLDWSGFISELTVNVKDKRLSPDTIRGKMTLHRETIRAVEGITTSWAYHASKKGVDVLTSSRFKIPDDVPGPVVLDATASQDVVSYLLGSDTCQTVDLPRSRSYQNVTLHVARDGKHGLGKTSMSKGRSERVKTLIKTIRSRNTSGNKWLLVVHKDVEETVAKFKPTDVHLSVAHWHAIDGKNDWNDHDNVVIFGLSYRDEVWADNALLSVKTDVDDEELRKVQAGKVRKMLQNRVMSADIIQAINRIRCRKVIDAQGNCPSADVWIILPSSEHGDYMLQALKDEMPGIKVELWDYDMATGERTTAFSGDIPVSPDNWQEAVTTHLRNTGVGEYPSALLIKRLNLDKATADKFKKALKDPKSALRTRLAAMGITLRVTGAGRGAQTMIHVPYELTQ